MSVVHVLSFSLGPKRTASFYTTVGGHIILFRIIHPDLDQFIGHHLNIAVPGFNIPKIQHTTQCNLERLHHESFKPCYGVSVFTIG